MLVAAYARVSTDRQDREQTIDSQVDALRRAAEQRGWHLAADLICRDDGRNGTTLARPGLDRLRDLVAEGTCAAVLVCSPDRLARNFAHQVLVIDEFRRAGCEVVFLNHAFGDSPEQQMLLQMQGVFAEYERALMLERTRRGRLFWARQGRVNWGGTPTYGYRLSRRTEPAPATGRRGERGGGGAPDVPLAGRGTAEFLRDQRAPARARRPNQPTERRRGWSQSSVIRVLSNSTYKGRAGTIAAGPSIGSSRVAGRGSRISARVMVTATPSDRSRNGSRCRCPPSLMLISGTWPRSSWPATASGRREQHPASIFLRALLICGRCGRRMIGVTDGGGRRRTSARPAIHVTYPVPAAAGASRQSRSRIRSGAGLPSSCRIPSCCGRTLRRAGAIPPSTGLMSARACAWSASSRPWTARSGG